MTDLYRRDQTDGISPPNLIDSSTFAEHVVHSRGKRTKYTSLSSIPDLVREFGDQLWKLIQPKITDEGHILVSNTDLLEQLQCDIREGDDHTRELASRAIHRVKNRREWLVDWHFDVSGVDRKDLITWASRHVRPYFVRG